MRFYFIGEESRGISVSRSCRMMKVSRSGYYKNREKTKSRCEIENERLMTLIRDRFYKTKEVEGSPRITVHLRGMGEKISVNRVARIMQKAGLKAHARRKWKKTTDSSHPNPKAPNLLKNHPLPEKSNRVLVSDITYIWTLEGWLYLCLILDLVTRKVVGWKLRERMSADLVVDALEMAVQNQKLEPGVIFHSDAGSQFASDAMREKLKQYGFIQSMSRSCYENAHMESLNHSLKVECVHRQIFHSREEARREIFEYLEIYYNRDRRHSSIGYLTPAEFESRIKKAA